jgi:hypothetical protein
VDRSNTVTADSKNWRHSGHESCAGTKANISDYLRHSWGLARPEWGWLPASRSSPAASWQGVRTRRSRNQSRRRRCP